MNSQRPLHPTPSLVSLSLALVLCAGCRGVPADTITPTDTPAEPCQSPAPEPSPPSVYEPLVHGGYATDTSESGDFYVETYFDFVGPIVRVRVRYLDKPEGNIDTSTYSTCEAEVEVPIRWTEAGFAIEQTITVTAERGDFERTELEPKPDGVRQSNTSKHMRSCWLTVLEGEYFIDQLSEATTRGRPNAMRLTEPDGKARTLEALPPVSESDFVEVVDDYFWSTP